MRVLVSTFGAGDTDKMLSAMRSLPYDSLVLIGEQGMDECDDLASIRRLEDMSGHEVIVETIYNGSFLDKVDSICEVLAKYAGARGASVKLNISGGSKLLGDAALLAAFRLGVETYHIDTRTVRLPVLKGATSKDRFTENQGRLIQTIGPEGIGLDALVEKMGPASRQSIDRVIREVKNLGLLMADVKERKVVLSLSPSGREVYNALRVAGHTQ